MAWNKFNQLQALRALLDFQGFHFDLPARPLQVFHSHPANLKFKLVFNIYKIEKLFILLFL